MRKTLIISAGLLTLSVATGFAQGASGSSTQDPAGFNSSGPGVTGNTAGNAVPASGYGVPPASARLNPADGARASTAGGGRSLDPTTYNSSGIGASNSTGANRAVRNPSMTTAQARSAVHPGDGASTHQSATIPSQSAPGFNTSGSGGTAGSTPNATVR